MILRKALGSVLENARQAVIGVLFNYIGQMQVVKTLLFKNISYSDTEFWRIIYTSSCNSGLLSSNDFKFHEENNVKK